MSPRRALRDRTQEKESDSRETGTQSNQSSIPQTLEAKEICPRGEKRRSQLACREPETKQQAHRGFRAQMAEVTN